MAVVEKIQESLTYYPIRGHSLLYVLALRKTSESLRKCTIIEVKNKDISNFKNWWSRIYKMNTISLETKTRNKLQNEKPNYPLS